MSSGIKRAKARDEEQPDSLAFEVTKPVDLAGLAEEIRLAHGWRKEVGLTAEGDLAAASPEAPVTVWVMRSDADSNAVRRAMTAHQGVEPAPPHTDELADLRSKVEAGGTLTEDEVQTALRLLLTRG